MGAGAKVLIDNAECFSNIERLDARPRTGHAPCLSALDLLDGRVQPEQLSAHPGDVRLNCECPVESIRIQP